MGSDRRFGPLTVDKIKYYVYALIDPANGIPFYIGKGSGNRVFQHVECALDEDSKSAKYDVIRNITDQGGKVSHIIIRYGLSENEALLVEATLIDALTYFGFPLTNLMRGHDSISEGLLTTDEIIQRFSAKPLKNMDDPAIIININRSYKIKQSIYQATKEAWVISRAKTRTLRYALAEYRGVIVEVFEIKEWYQVPSVSSTGKRKIRWGFNGDIAPQEVRAKYIHRSLHHIKKRGASNPVRYHL